LPVSALQKWQILKLVHKFISHQDKLAGIIISQSINSIFFKIYAWKFILMMGKFIN